MAKTPLKLFIPIRKVDAVRREVAGVLAEEAVDKSGEIMDYGKSKPYFEAWSKQFDKATGGKSKGNLREQHTTKAIGKFTAVEFDDAAKVVRVVAKVVDDDAWSKVMEGVYTGFSVGGDYVARKSETVDGASVVRYTAKPGEGSLVDNPCMYGTIFDVLNSAGSGSLRKRLFGASLNELRDAGAGLAGLIKSVMKGAPLAKLNGHDVDLVMKLELARAIGSSADAALAKDGAAAVGAANAAISELKALASELALLDGDPDTLALSDVVDAIRAALFARQGAEAAAADEATVPVAAPAAVTSVDGAAEPDGDEVMAAGAKPGKVKKAEDDDEEDDEEDEDAEEGDDAKPTPTEAAEEGGTGGADNAPAKEDAPADDDEDEEDEEDEEDDDAEKGRHAGDLLAVVNALKALGAGLSALSQQVAKGQGLAKASVSKAADKATELKKALDVLEARLTVVEDTPVAPGRPARKTIGVTDGEGGGGMADVTRLSAHVDALKAAGAIAPDAEARIRKELAIAAMWVPRQTG